MMKPSPEEPLTEEELDRLEEILQAAGEDQGMTVEGLDGMFAALVCSPVLAQPSEWMPLVWGGDPPEWSTMEEAQEAITLVMRMWDQVAGSINDGSFSPLMATGIDKDGNEGAFPHPWCMGFVEGMRVHQQYWFDETNQELEELLRLIGLVAYDARVLLGEVAEPEGRLTQAQLNEISDLIPDIVLALRRYWIEHPAPPSVRGSASQVSPTDACPCGSGKKFKDCHGTSVH